MHRKSFQNHDHQLFLHIWEDLHGISTNLCGIIQSFQCHWIVLFSKPVLHILNLLKYQILIIGEDDDITFDFLVSGALLRSTLSEFIEKNGITTVSY